VAYLQHSKLRDEELIDNSCPDCKTDNLWRFETENGEMYIDECTKCRYTKWWVDEE